LSCEFETSGAYRKDWPADSRRQFPRTDMRGPFLRVIFAEAPHQRGPEFIAESDLMIAVTIDDQDHTADIPAAVLLLRVLRDVVGLTGTRFGCGIGGAELRDWPVWATDWPCPPGTDRPRRV
jgi:hypothetical protein